MNTGEYRTNGKSVAYRRDASTCVVWADAESVSADRMTNGAEYFTWRTMTPGEVMLWCAPPRVMDWQARAETAETALAAVLVAVAEWPRPTHSGQCRETCEEDCNFAAEKKARTEARQLLGLEPKP